MLVVWRKRASGSRKGSVVVLTQPSESDGEDGHGFEADDDDDDDDGSTTHDGGLDSLSPSPSPSPSANNTSSSTFPPTPQHIPYRLTSTIHPIHARSMGSSVITKGSNTGGYDLEESGALEVVEGGTSTRESSTASVEGEWTPESDWGSS